MSEQLEEERAQHKQLSCALAKECKWASARALEEGHRLTELSRKLDKVAPDPPRNYISPCSLSVVSLAASCLFLVFAFWAREDLGWWSHKWLLGRKVNKALPPQEKETCQLLRKELEDERRRALRMEARVEEQLAEFDTEREQLRSRLKKEEAHCCHLQQQVGRRQRFQPDFPTHQLMVPVLFSGSLQLEELRSVLEEVNTVKDGGGAVASPAVEQEKVEWATKVQGCKMEDTHEDGSILRCSEETNGYHGTDDVSEKVGPENGSDGCAGPHTQTLFFPCSAVPSPLPPSSPCASPVLGKCASGSVSPGGYHHSSYQAGINQRFHAARHKFQGTAEPDPQPQAPPQTPSCPKEESSPVKQMARSTVTQVLSRFTTVHQQSAPAKPAGGNSSPFGTDYRSLAAPPSPVVSRAAGVRSPTIPRSDRGHPPPIPPKKPGLAQAPASPAPVPRSASHFADSGLSGSCGLTSSQEGVKELDMVVSSN